MFMRALISPLPEYIKRLAGRKLPGEYSISGSADMASSMVCGEGASAYVLNAIGPMGTRKAIKILKKEHVADETARGRFREEIDKLRKVSHPNIISVENLGELRATDDGGHYVLPYYLMEFVEGAPIDKWAREKEQTGKHPEPDTICSLTRQVVMPLAHVHSADPPIFHLDLKPSNILVSWDGGPKVGDFGLALVMAPQVVVPVPSLGGRPIESMHPEFRRMFTGGFELGGLN